MIDWASLSIAGCSVLGLGLILSTLSLAGWAAQVTRQTTRQAWTCRLGIALSLGAFLLALGTTLQASGWRDRIIGAVCTLSLAGVAIHDLLHIRRHGPPPHSILRVVSTHPARARLYDGWSRIVLPATLVLALLMLVGRRPALVGLSMILIVWFAGWLARGHPTARTPLDWPITLILASTLVGVTVSVDRALSLVTLLTLIPGIAILLAVVAWVGSERRVVLSAGMLVLFGAGLAVSALFSHTEWMTGKFFGVPGFVSRLAFLPETIQTNVLAGGLVVVLPVGLSLLIRRRASPIGPLPAGALQLTLGAACLLMAVVLVLTQSRGGLLAFAASLAALAMLRWRPARVLVPVLVVGAGIWVLTSVRAQVLNLLLSGGMFSSFEGRLEVWSRAIYMLQDFPFTGIGMGTFQLVAPVMYPFFLAGPDAVIPHAHNLFLQVGVDLGIPGLVAFLSLLMLVVFMAWRVYSSARAPFARHLAAGLLASCAALVVHGLVDAVTWGTRPSFLVWMVFGLTAALWRVGLRKPSGEGPAVCMSSHESEPSP